MRTKPIPWRLVQRTSFWARTVAEEDSGCLIWLGSGLRDGYGTIKIYRDELKIGIFLAHRVAWALHHKKDPGRLLVCHTCDNPPCINPKHLFAGTHFQNTMDARNKGRLHGGNIHGEQHYCAKLTSSEIRRIRLLHQRGTSPANIARQFSIERGHVYNIVNRHCWAWL